MSRGRITIVLAGVLGVVMVGALLLSSGSETARADPGTVNAGHDLLETDSANTYLDLALPSDFFGPGSDPFEGQVYMEGVPIPSFGGFSDLGPTSTIVERLQNAGPAFPATIPIEIVALDLRSVAPITVTYNGGQNPELWHMTAQVPEGDPQQVTGSMTVRHETADGGTFDSTLPVRPLVTFTRVTPPGVVEPFYYPGLLVFQASNVDWCHTANPLHSPPHTVIEKPGLTTNFFPGILCEPDGPEVTRTKSWTPQSALNAKHTVRPAELATHYKWYQIAGPPLNTPASVETQFGLEVVMIDSPVALLPPALKNGEGDLNEPHLKCYNIVSSEDPPEVVNLTTQFGYEFGVEVGPARELCMPAAKEVVLPFPVPPGPLLPEPHYKCYEITGDPLGVIVDLMTQFGPEPGVLLGVPSRLCAPAIKNGEGTLNHPHLKCYDMPPGAPPNFIVNLTTQFGLEPNVNVGPANRLCMPVAKEIVTPPVGGLAELPDAAQAPASHSGSSAPLYIPLTAVGAAAVLTIAAGGWYARRRWGR